MKTFLISLSILATLAPSKSVFAAANATAKSAQDAGVNTGALKLNVEGMTCGGCEASIESKVSKVAGVASVKADHKAKNVVVTAKSGETVDPEAVKKAVTDAGYKVK